MSKELEDDSILEKIHHQLCHLVMSINELTKVLDKRLKEIDNTIDYIRINTDDL